MRTQRSRQWFRPVSESALVALTANQYSANFFKSACSCDDPRSVEPRWIVSNVLVVPAFQLCDPIVLLIEMKSHNVSLSHL